jgi:hypothetical protein
VPERPFPDIVLATTLANARPLDWREEITLHCRLRNYRVFVRLTSDRQRAKKRTVASHRKDRDLSRSQILILLS